MKKHVLHTSLAVALLMTASCGKDFLEQLPETTRTTAAVYKTPSDFQNAVIGAYSTLKHNGLYANGGPSSALLHLGEMPMVSVNGRCVYATMAGTCA